MLLQRHGAAVRFVPFVANGLANVHALRPDVGGITLGAPLQIANA